MRWFLKLSYRGAPFHGWQRQPNAGSVQQTVEEALATVLRRETPIVGAGRTDTGVNARTMFAHFDTKSPIGDRRRFLLSLNRLCGRDIAFHDVLPVRDDAHARFDATARQYRYFVTEEKSPFIYPLSWQQTSPLDYAAMNRAAGLLLTTSDFTSFAKLHTDTRTNICRVSRALWRRPLPGERVPGEATWIFEITADRFLRNMVRAVVGTLVEVGRGRMTLEAFRQVIEQGNRTAAGESMPGNALFLERIEY